MICVEIGGIFEDKIKMNNNFDKIQDEIQLKQMKSATVMQE